MIVKKFTKCLYGNLQGMYCLGGVTDSSTIMTTTMTTSTSPPSSMSGNREGVLSVVRALGVLVCEGRIQGSSRGYREGPHCAAPLQLPPSHHVCKKENNLCNRYVILVKEIADRTAMGMSLCIEVFMCADCPCGLATTTDPVSLITQWSNTSEKLLEYWCITVVPSKNLETMNIQGLYQAVRSRLHFSQVAAWWSRSNGSKPTYVSTRFVSNNPDNLRKFRESPIEHTFPLASIGDGNSVNVTVWALPRVEEVPELLCSIHPSIIKQDDDVACALTPTITTYTDTHNMILPIIVDDRLQTSCDQPGKHHCRCEDDETSPPSPSIKPNGERKRRRSLPCGPSDNIPSTSNFGNNSLSSVSENNSHNNNNNNNNNTVDKNDDNNYCHDDLIKSKRSDKITSDNPTYIILGNHDKLLKSQQLNHDDSEGNNEKRYKPSTEVGIHFETLKLSSDINGKNDNQLTNYIDNIDKLKTNDTMNLCKPNVIVNPFYATNPGPSNYNCNNISLTPCNVHLNYTKISTETIDNNEKQILPLPSGELTHLMSKLSFPKESTKLVKDEGGIFDWISKVPGRVLNVNQNSTSTITNHTDDNKIIVQGQNNTIKNHNEIKLKNCNLELSQREFNEVLAVLRSRTPSGRRRTPVKNQRKRDKIDKLTDDQINIKNSSINSVNKQTTKNQIKSSTMVNCNCCTNKNINTSSINGMNEPNDNTTNKADVLLGAILRTNRDRKGLSDISNGTCTETTIPIIEDKKNQDIIDKQVQLPLKIKPYEDEKFLPSVLNKRLLRLKQLFKKEQEPKIFTDISSDNNNHDLRDLKKNHYNNYNDNNKTVKRKIDFTDFNVGFKSDYSYEPLVNDTDNFQKTTNNIKSNDNYQLFDEKINQNGCEESNNDGDKKLNRKLNDGIMMMNGSTICNKTDNFNQDDLDDEITDRNVPSVVEQERFRRSLENAASMVFHSRTGLPLTSSPAPLRRGHCCFDYDSSLNTVSSKRSALFELNTPPSPGAVSLEETDREVENICDGDEPQKRSLSSRIRPQSHALLGNFEESALNGRLEPVSTVHGFTAEIGASGSFCPKHRKLPVTVFFYTLGDNDKVSTPYLAHINLEKKGYQVPRSGTIQVTLLNPLGTVVKMFVVLYDLSDMPPRSHTFLRQRTLRDKTLRYLIHLRFMSGKSGRIYLHTDIRMIICRKSDVDTASDFGSEPQKELRSYIHGPTNPKFSPRC